MVANATDFVTDAELESWLRASVTDDGTRIYTARDSAISYVERWIADAILDTTHTIYDMRPLATDAILCLDVSYVQSGHAYLDAPDRTNVATVQASRNPGGEQAHIIPVGRQTLIRPPQGGWPEDMVSAEGDYRLVLDVGATSEDIDPLWKRTVLSLVSAYYDGDVAEIAAAESKSQNDLIGYYRFPRT